MSLLEIRETLLEEDVMDAVELLAENMLDQDGDEGEEEGTSVIQHLLLYQEDRGTY